MSCARGGMDTKDAASATEPKIIYGDIPTLREAIKSHFGKELELPVIHETDLGLLDDAISLLNPPEVQLHVVEVDTYTESEQSIARGNIPLGEDKDTYCQRQKSIILKRVLGTPYDPASAPVKTLADKPPLPAPSATAEGPTASGVNTMVVITGLSELPSVGAAEAHQPETDSAQARTGTNQSKLPEIILFWARNRRCGGNLVVCPENSMDRLIEAYLVCEVVEKIETVGDKLLGPREGALMGVEIGEGSPAEQGAIESLISDYSFHDASVGIVSLAASIYFFGFLGKNYVNVLTLLAVAVVAGLNQEATWPWVFRLILQCSRIEDPIVRVAKCRLVHHHQGQLSGQGVLAIGLAVFGVYLEVVPTEDGDTPLLFRILLNVFQGLMLAVLVMNMVQAIEPIAVSNLGVADHLRGWAKLYLQERVYDTVWYLTLIVALVWAGAIAVVVSQLPYEGDHLGWDVFIACLVVLVLSLCTVNPGMALLGLWGLIWLIPVGLSFVLRSTFDLLTMLINRVNITLRRMTREAAKHVRASSKGAFSVRDTLILLLQVLPITPLMLVFVPIPLLYLLAWLMHLSLRACLVAADVFVYPISAFKMYPILSDYGAVSWKLNRLTMEVEKRGMCTLLEERVKMLMEKGRLGQHLEAGVLPCKPYAQLDHSSDPRLGCIAIEVNPHDGGRMLLTGKEDLDKKLREKVKSRKASDDEGGGGDGASGNAPSVRVAPSRGEEV